MPDKTLKISVSTDQNSARMTKRVIDDLTVSMTKLVEMTNRLAQTMAGLSNGRGVQGVSMSTRSPIGTVGGAGGPLATARGGSQGILGSLLGAGNAQGVQALGSATVSSLGAVESKIKTFVNSTVQELSKLQTAVSNATGALGGMAGGGGSDRPGYHWKSGEWWPDRPKGRGAPKVEEAEAPEEEAEAPEEEAGGPGPSVRTKKSKKAKKAGGILGGSLGGVFPDLNPIFSAANLGVVGVGLAGRYGFGKGEEINQWMTSERSIRIGRTLDLPWEVSGRKAEMYSPFRNMASDIMGKNYAGRMAWQSVMNDPEVMKSIFNVDLRKEQAEYRSGLRGTAKATLEEIADRVRNSDGIIAGIGSAVYGAVSPIQGGPSAGVTGLTQRTIKEQNVFASIGPEQAKELQEATDLALSLQDPFVQQGVGEVYGNQVSRYAMARAVGQADRRATINGIERTTEGLRRQRMAARGRDQGEIPGARQALFSIGQGYGAAFGQESDMMLSYGEMGLGNFPQLLKLGGLLTGKVGSNKDPTGAYGFIKNILQGTIGTGGNDVAVGREIAETFGQMSLQAGIRGGAAEDLIKNAARFVHNEQGVGFDVAGQQRRMLELQEGLGSIGGFSQGTIAPLYGALSTVSSIKANGGVFDYTSMRLNELSAPNLWSYAHGGRISSTDADMGITQAKAQEQLKSAQKFLFAEVMPSLLGSTSDYTKDAFARVKSAGYNPQLAIIKKLGEMREKDPNIRASALAGEEQRFRAALAGPIGTALKQSPGAIKGALSLTESLADFVGKGVGIVGLGPAAKKAAEDAAKYEGEYDKSRVKGEKAVEEGLGGDVTAMMEGIKASKGALGGLPGVTDDLITALQAFKGAVQNYSSSSTTAPKKVVSPNKSHKAFPIIPWDTSQSVPPGFRTSIP